MSWLKTTLKYFNELVDLFSSDLNDDIKLFQTKVFFFGFFFIYFGEEYGILPINHPLYQKYQLHLLIEETNCIILLEELFELLQTGYSEIGLLPYTGFLFHQPIDEILQVLKNKVNEVQPILKTLLQELDANKKAIFRSVGELYEELVGVQKPPLKKTTGTFYTPDYITQFMVQTLMENLEKELDTLKVLDPSCGTGRLLHEVAVFLKKQNPHIDVLSQIYGVDLDPFAVDIAKFTLWLKYGSPSWDFSPLNHQIKCANSLFFGSLADLAGSVQNTLYSAKFKDFLDSIKKYGISNPLILDYLKVLLDLKLLESLKGVSLTSSYYELLQELLHFSEEKDLTSLKRSKDNNFFHWELEFPEIFLSSSENIGFDAIIGNPPYITESRGNKSLFREMKCVPYLRKTYEKNMDLFTWFTHLSIDLLSENGILCFILPAYWTIRSSTSKLRERILKETQILKVVDFGSFKVFPVAPGHHSHILFLKKTCLQQNQETVPVMAFSDLPKGDYSQQVLTVEKKLIQDKFDQYQLYISANKFIFQPKAVIERIKKMKETPHFYLSPASVVRGVDLQPSRYKGQGVFVLTSEELNNLSLNPEEETFIKPFYRASQLDAYYFDPNNQFWLIYTDQKRKKILETNPERFPNLIKHFSKFRSIITSDNAPYGLHRPKKEENFETPHKILFVRKTSHPKFVYVSIPYYVDESVYVLLCEKLTVHPYFLLGVLNSSLAREWFAVHKAQGKHLQIDKEVILNFPIPKIIFKRNPLLKNEEIAEIWEKSQKDYNYLISTLTDWKNQKADDLIHNFIVLIVELLITKIHIPTSSPSESELRQIVDRAIAILYTL
ncbi:MAG: Eco57I restriction-modification methylase domain-containing protein [Promethearchaeota archaeon]